MHLIIYLSIPVIAAFIGWLTNFLAVKMIFRPRKEIRLFGLRIIGLIPKRKHDLAEKIAETVEKELISHRDIRAILQSEDFHLTTNEAIRTKIEAFINSKVTGNPLLAMFVTPDMTTRLTEMLMEELQKEVPNLINALFESVEHKIDFREIIKNKIEGFDLSKLESIIYAIAAKELKAIEILGGVLGFIVGLVQIILIRIGNVYG